MLVSPAWLLEALLLRLASSILERLFSNVCSVAILPPAVVDGTAVVEAVFLLLLLLFLLIIFVEDEEDFPMLARDNQ